MPAHVFLCYSRQDEDQAEQISQSLRAEGLKVWRDQDALAPGQDFWQAIETNIREAGCLLVFLTRDSQSNENIKREVALANSQSIPIIPLMKNMSGDQLDDWWRKEIGHIQSIPLNYITSKIRKKIAQTARSHAHRICQTIAIFNMKGGVGKTTLAAQLGARLSSELKKNVLLVDLDPQQNLSELFLTPDELHEKQRLHHSIIGLFEPKLIDKESNERLPWLYELDWSDELRSFINRIPFRMESNILNCGRLDLIASQFDAIKYTEIGVDQRNRIIQNFAQSLEVLKRQYEYIIIDCNPSVSLLTRCALKNCKRILSPVRPDQTARRGLIFMKHAMEFYSLAEQPDISIVFNCVRRPIVRKERLLMKSLRDGTAGSEMPQFVGKYLKTEIPESNVLRATYSKILRPEGGESALRRFLRSFTAWGRAETPLSELAHEYVDLIEGRHESQDQRVA
jgi:chromosome partitioning protein